MAAAHAILAGPRCGRSPTGTPPPVAGPWRRCPRTRGWLGRCSTGRRSSALNGQPRSSPCSPTTSAPREATSSPLCGTPAAPEGPGARRRLACVALVPPARGDGAADRRPGRGARRRARAPRPHRAPAPRRLHVPHDLRHGCGSPAGLGPRGTAVARGRGRRPRRRPAGRDDPLGRADRPRPGERGRARAAAHAGRRRVVERRRRRPPGASVRCDRAVVGAARRPAARPRRARRCGPGCSAKGSGCCAGPRRPRACGGGWTSCTARSATRGPTCPTTALLAAGGLDLSGVRNLARFDVLQALRGLLPWPAAARLDDLAPERLPVPSGSSVRVDYAGDQPVLAVRLQETFGWRATPRLADGRVPVLLHLLSPAGRPAAVTADLESFWRTGYPQVRAELRGPVPEARLARGPVGGRARARGAPAPLTVTSASSARRRSRSPHPVTFPTTSLASSATSSAISCGRVNRPVTDWPAAADEIAAGSLPEARHQSRRDAVGSQPQVGRHRPGADRVEADPARADLLGQRLGEVGQRRLRRAVVDDRRVGQERVDRADRDDRPAARGRASGRARPGSPGRRPQAEVEGRRATARR